MVRAPMVTFSHLCISHLTPSLLDHSTPEAQSNRPPATQLVRQREGGTKGTFAVCWASPQREGTKNSILHLRKWRLGLVLSHGAGCSEL